MTKVIILIYFILAQIITALAFVINYKHKDYPAKIMLHMLVIALITGFMYLGTIVFESFSVQRILCVFYISSMPLLCYFLGRYLVAIAFPKIKYNKAIVLTVIAAIVDSIVILLDLKFGAILKFEQGRENEINCIIFKGTGLYSIHLIICYLPILIGVVCNIIVALKTPKFYRRKNLNVLSVVLMLVIVNVIYLATKLQIDLTVGLYGVAAIILTYLSYIHVPNKLKEALSELLVENSNLAIIFYDIYGNRIINNEYYRDWANKLSMDFEKIQKFYSDAKQINEKTREKELIVDYNNQKYYFKCKAVNVSYRNRKNQEIPLGYVYNAQDNTEAVLQNIRNQRNLTHDEFTDLYNFSYFSMIGEKMIRSDSSTQYIFMVNDLKQFKMFNGIMGDEAGNQVIKKISDILRDNIHNSKVIYCRIVSDRFGIIGPKDVLMPLLKSNPVFLEPIVYSGYKIRNCIGIYEINDLNINFNLMYQRALVALSEAKKKSKENYYIYNSKYAKEKVDEINMLNEFNHALDNGQFEIYVQPQYETSTKIISGGEVLVRRIRNGEVISPSQFIPVLENTGLITKLDTYVWDRTGALMKKLIDNDYKGTLSVNVSAQDIYSIDIVKFFKELTQKYDIAASRLKIEITESYIVENMDKYKKLISDMNQNGFMVEMDDFGSGYSSLNSLKDAPVNALKLDMKFLSDYGDSNRSNIIIKSIVEMAKALGIPVIAEGVETDKQYEYLKSINCEYIQGYLLGKPMPVDSFIEKIRS